MKHLGDITKISGAAVPPVDVVIGGSPCQDLSIAGRRAGLAGERSGLFMEQVRIIKEMREEDVKRGRTGLFLRPRFMVWENVPGAFSSNGGNDFRAVLEETIRIAEPDAPDIPLPTKGRWPVADCWMGDGWSVAYRVFDSQFWGVPQRRRRIALVADFGGHAAPEILFIRKGVCGNLAEGGTQREEIAARIGDGTYPTIARSLTARNDGSPCADRGPAIVLQALPFDTTQITWPSCRSHPHYGDPSHTLSANSHPPAVSIKKEIVAGFKPHASASARSIGYEEEKSPTIDTGKPMAVFRGGTDYLTGWDSQEKRVFSAKGVSPTLSGSDGGYIYDARGNGDGKTACTITGDHQSRVTDYTAIVMVTGQGGTEIMTDKSPTLTCNREQPIVAAVNCRNSTVNPEINGTLQAKPNGGMSLNLNNVVMISPPDTVAESGCLTPWDIQSRRIVGEDGVSQTLYSKGKSGGAEGQTIFTGFLRRLTPLECERLQGYPDGWTDIGEWTDSTGKLHKESSDSARYKALGNSIALPPWAWVLKRLCACYEHPATMASLFDGIGGFPLLWERLNGPGSCIWASEIEEFPIAVTKRRLGDCR